MNLIQIQDDLRQLPNTPQTLQLLAQYANGMNPTVPPYVALGELQTRNKRMQQLAQQQQAAQQPQGTVNEQIQQQTLQQLQPQPQQMPQAPQMPQQGGVASLPVQGNVAKFGSGGIVAFAKAGRVDGEDDDDDEDSEGGEAVLVGEDVVVGEAGNDRLAKAKYEALQAQADRLRGQGSSAPKESPEQMRARLAKENPELFGMLVKPPGGDVESRLAELQTAQAAEYAKQRAEAQKMKPSLFQQLGEAAIGSRGQYGRSALASILGGYSSIANKQEQQALEQEQGLRMKELGLQQAKMEVLNKLDEARRAHAEGRFDDEQKFHVEAAKIASQQNTTVANLLGKQVSAAGTLAGREAAAAAQVEAARVRASKPAAPKTPTDQANGVAILAKQLRVEHPEWSEEKIQSQALKDYRIGLAPSGINAGVKATSDAVKALSEFSLLNNKQWKAFVAGYPDEKSARSAWIAAYKQDALPAELLPGMVSSTAPAATPAPAPATAAATSTPPVSALKKGMDTTFSNGQVWTLDNDGKPKRVK